MRSRSRRSSRRGPRVRPSLTAGDRRRLPPRRPHDRQVRKGESYLNWKIDELREYVLPRSDWLFGYREIERRQEDVPEHLNGPRRHRQDHSALRASPPSPASRLHGRAGSADAPAARTVMTGNVGTVVGHRPQARTFGGADPPGMKWRLSVDRQAAWAAPKRGGGEHTAPPAQDPRSPVLVHATRVKLGLCGRPASL